MNREVLEKPFREDQIKQRNGEHGDVLDYLEGASVIHRLNEAFGAEWSFEVTEHLIQEKEVLVLGKLTALGITKTQFGNKKREGSVGDDLKAATTDCIKKCATLFGVGLHLYFDLKITGTTPPAQAETRRYVPPTPPSPAPTFPPPTRPAENGNGDRLTDKQLSAIFGIAKGKGWTTKATLDYVRDHFRKNPDVLTKREASALIDRMKAGTS